jgi:hypothetical protein
MVDDREKKVKMKEKGGTVHRVMSYTGAASHAIPIPVGRVPRKSSVGVGGNADADHGLSSVSTQSPRSSE